MNRIKTRCGMWAAWVCAGVLLSACGGGGGGDGDAPAVEPPLAPLALGGAHTCALKGGSVSCWGSNASGQLGNGVVGGKRSVSTAAVTVMDGNDQPLQGIRAIAAGGDFTCAVTAQSTVVCWGEGERGQLGSVQSASGKAVAVPAPVEDVASLVAGSGHACVLSHAGVVRCWGDNTHAQVLGTVSGPLTGPVAVDLQPIPADDPVQSIAAGATHTCVRTSKRRVFCWGDNTQSELGFNTGASTRSDAVGTGLLLQAAAGLVLGSHTSCMLRNRDVPVCWGRLLTSGQPAELPVLAGLPPVPEQATLSQLLVPGGRVDQFALGVDFGCAVINGAVACLGESRNGELGNGEVNPFGPAVPPAFFGARFVQGTLTNVKTVVSSASSSHVCAITTQDDVFCWGDGRSGQLGTGVAPEEATTGIAAPVTVFSLK